MVISLMPECPSSIPADQELIERGEEVEVVLFCDGRVPGCEGARVQGYDDGIQ